MNRERALELKVGIFVAIGLAMIGGFVLKFGRLGEGFKIYYDLTVRFKDASGLLKGSDILLSGAKIGRVSGGPRLLREGEGVAVPIRIYEYVKIPKGSQFTVGSSGLLGDRFVNVITPPGPAKEYLQKNAVVDGARPSGIDDLTHAGSQLIEELRGTVQNINGTFTRLNTEALSPEAMHDLRSSSSEEIEAPMTPQKVTNSTRRRLTVKSGVIFQGELRRFAGEGDGPTLAAESR